MSGSVDITSKYTYSTFNKNPVIHVIASQQLCCLTLLQSHTAPQPIKHQSQSMDVEEISQAFAEADNTDIQDPYCGRFLEKPCSESSTTTTLPSTSPTTGFTVTTTPGASWYPLSLLPETASYSLVSTSPYVSVTSLSTEALTTPTITSTIAPAAATATRSAETTSSASTTTISRSNTTKTVAIAVPVAVGSLAIIAAVLAFLLWRRRRKANHKRAPSAEMSHEAGTAFLPRNDTPMDVPAPGCSSRFREPIAPQPVPHYTPTPNTPSETRLMDTPTQSLIPIPPAPPRYSALTTRDGNQMQNHERHSALTVENLAALHGWESAEVGDTADEHARSPFRDPSDGASTISAVSDLGSPSARRNRDADEISVVSSLGDEHGDRDRRGEK